MTDTTYCDDTSAMQTTGLGQYCQVIETVQWPVSS